MKRFCCTDALDAIDLEQLARGGSVSDAVRRLAARYGVVEDVAPRPSRSHFSNDQLAQAEQFRAGLAWRIERALVRLKRAVSDETRLLASATRTLTHQLACIQTWSVYDAVDAYEALNSINPRLAMQCVAEASEAQASLAALIAAFGIQSTAAAA